MYDYEFSEHASDMMKECNIQEKWVKTAIGNPDEVETKEDGTVHYIKSIEQYGGG
ncbi:MAG: DUF4258 domain-containing protein [candidate division KSB1 bacterium]|nr:DUF4258 domain-containing protein [candidate division KSB1 bacterium]